MLHHICLGMFCWLSTVEGKKTIMSAYSKSVQLALGGTDAEKVAVLQTLTSGPIPVSEVIQFFDEQNLAELDPIDNAWVGSLIDVVRNENTPAELVAGLRALFVHLAKRTSQTVDTTIPMIAVQTWTLLSALVQMQVVTTAQRDAFYALDGGRPFADLTVEQFTSQREAAEAADAAAQAAEASQAKKYAWQQRFDAALNTIGTVEQADGIADVVAITQEMAE
jgi:hypothetical protein